MARAEDLGGYYRIPADSRDLNYDKYFVEGETQIAQIDDYTSHNTRRLDVEQVKARAAEAARWCARRSVLKVMTIVGTRPEIIRLSRVIEKLDRHCEHVLVHTGQNYDYELNEVFFERARHPQARTTSWRRPAPHAAETIGNVIIAADAVLEKHQPDALLLLGDTNSCLAAIAAKRRKIPIFHMEAGNRCFDFRVPEEINRRIVDHIADINLHLQRDRARVPAARGPAAGPGDQDRQPDARGARALPRRHRGLGRACSAWA